MTAHDPIFPSKALFSEDPDGLLGIDISNVGELFPIKKERVYFNNASIGALGNPIVNSVNRFLQNCQINGRNDYPNWCRYADTVIKERIAKLIGAKRSEIAFVKNTTEGLVTVANGLNWRTGDNVILPDIEYPSNVYCWMKLAAKGVTIRWVRNRDGRISTDDIRAAMDERTRLVSLSAVQFSNGFRHDLEATASLCRENNVLLNLDAIQWVGALEMNVDQIGIDFMSFGGHKWMLAPVGTGVFYCRDGALDLLDPPSVGYHTVDRGEDHMEYLLDYRPDAGRFEEALVNFPGIWGLDAAVRIQLELTPKAIEEHILGLTSRAAEGMLRKGYAITSPFGDAERSGNLSFTHPFHSPAEIDAHLRSNGIDLAQRAGMLRISPSYYNDVDEIDRLVDELL